MKGTIKVLMLKHLLVRVRRFIHTTVELLSPAVFFIILFIFKDNINQPKPSHAQDELNIYNTEPAPLESFHAPRLLFYTPDTDLTGLLMDRVGDKLGIERLKYFPNGHLKGSGYYPIADIADLNEHMNIIDEQQAVIVFQNMTGTWPQHLNYTIRIKVDFLTHLYDPLDGGVGPHERFGTIYEPFMRLQWAIDSSYLQLMGADINQTVTLQEFPYVNSRDNINQVIQILSSVLMVLCWMSLLLVFVFLMSRLLEERTTGIEELIKMMGVSGNTLGVSHFLNVLPTGLVYCIVNTTLLTATSNPIVPSSSPILISVMMALHFVSVIAMAFACSYLVKNTQYAVTMSMFAYVALWVPARVVDSRPPPWALLPLAGLLPHFPMHSFWKELAALEQFGHGLTFSNMTTTHGLHTLPVVLCLLFLLVQSTIFFLLAWYLSLVNPGPYGQALPWNFIFQRQFWCPKKVTPNPEFKELEEPITYDPLYFEAAPKNVEVGIKIVNVTMAFPKNLALSNVSLDIYKGEITVLLGHNGAGKTTLMSIITGMISATSGKVYVEGLDNVTQKDKVRKLIGLCPQHNLFFPDLTVMEHVMFFTMLKGSSYHEAKVEATQLLQQLGLADKRSSKSSQLSGGMRRRLQLGCALAGRAQVLVLDEPTSGLDVETRRELWDLLLSLRGDRTVLLTTHFMEEADALGDRVAALHGGRLRCHATTMHLKRAQGTGYRLSFTTIGIPKEEAITAVVKSQVADASVKEKALNSITYNLPAKSSSSFPQLFKTLESKRSELAIDSIGVGISTLEEVFLKLCSDVDTTFTEDTVDGGPVEAMHTKLSGARLYCRQLVVLLQRQVNYMWSKKMSVVILQVIMPILTLAVFTFITNKIESDVKRNSAVSMDLSIYADMPTRRVLYNTIATTANLRSVTVHHDTVVFEKTDDTIASILGYGKKDVIEYNKYLLGIEFNDTDAKVLFTTRVRHTAPVALNLLSNMIAARYTSWADGNTITTFNLPLTDPNKDVTMITDMVQPKDIVLSVMWATAVVFVILATNINLVSLACKERVSGARHLHVLAGCAAPLHWAATLLAHAALCTLTLLLPVLLLAATLDTDATLSQGDFLGAIFMVLLLGSLSFFSFMYLVSFYFGERGSSTVLVGCVIIFGFLTTSMKTAQDIFKEGQSKSFSYYVATLCGYVAPPHTLTMAAMKAVNVARLNAYCVLNKLRCPALFVPENGFDAVTCCNSNRNPRCYFCIDEYSPGGSMLILFCQFVVYMTLVILTQHGVFNKLADRLFNQRYSPRDKDSTDEMVRAEKTYVSKAITLPPDQIQEAMLVDDIHKNYVQFVRKSCNAVKGISFSVKKGECFGLLGVNGAGKSTTFKMLTAEECPTRGNIFANGQHLNQNRGKYLRSLGYCPQFFGLDEFLSGYANLALVLTLRGLSAEDVRREVKSWIEVVGLEQYQHRAVSRYSGGMARRLAAGAALCSGAAVTLLDEPTAGVDVAARRRVWAALRRALAARRATLVTSHSMDEMEALCSRIAIMSGGQIRALGSAAALRAAYASGHAVQLKLRPLTATDETDGAKSDVQRLKSELHQKFNCQLKDEHKTMLHYHINETMRYSDLFTELETLKNSNPIVEDYSVTETTLEEVFLSFAKETEDQPNETDVTPV